MVEYLDLNLKHFEENLHPPEVFEPFDSVDKHVSEIYTIDYFELLIDNVVNKLNIDK